MGARVILWGMAGLAALALWGGSAAGAQTPTAPLRNWGPYNDTFLEGGIGDTRPLVGAAPATAGSWSMSGWLNLTRAPDAGAVVAALGDAAGAAGAEGWRGVYLEQGRLGAAGGGVRVPGGPVLEPGRWYAVAVSADGVTLRLYVDGVAVGQAPAATPAVAPQIQLAPVAEGPDAPSATAHVGGSLALWTVQPIALDAAAVAGLARTRPDFSRITFTPVGVGWPWQEHAWRGLQVPQDPWTLPQAHTAPESGVARPARSVPGGLAALTAQGARVENWHLAAAPTVTADGAALSQTGYREPAWVAAEVPGTVLTTLIARGIYPDPDYGLNNLAIPESLSRQAYWYRSVFTAPAAWAGRHLTLTFNGINYAAEAWLNGRPLGTVRGAFQRGVFDVSGVLNAGAENALAVRVEPPPHPGIPHEQSILAGPGNNGGALAIDGPTFIATEGWDWIPGIRDRNTGLWQDVVLGASGALTLGDPQVITRLPLPRTDAADLTLRVPLENHRAGPVAGTLTARFDGVVVEKRLNLPPGPSEVRLDPAEFAQLHLRAPRLWWPNGYGEPALHTLTLEVRSEGALSDTTQVRFGIRELTYELSLFDHSGRLRRVEIDPTQAALGGERLVDVRHEAIKRTPNGWAASLTAAGERSAAVHPLEPGGLSPYLVIRVNGVRIAARGGSWGMDDLLKRSSRQHLEPYFRLHREAHLNIIRNWLGQNTEEVFYDLADEYGLLVLNDFWVSTQDFQMEPEDPALFLANARDVILRYRHHPSIALWFGRNEGVPQPILNTGLDALVATLDGTRYYTGSSNAVNLQGSGPYDYRPPEQYFTSLARGFSVEVGTPSLATLEAIEASIPPADRWPLSDTFAYHDWHFGGNGDVAGFMAAMAAQYGAGTSLADFERKAQLMNYDSYRAIFEGFQAHLWTRNSGRLLWMTHPSWPSNTWQIYSSDYDTGAAYYAVKKACEPLHAQLDLPDYRPAVINTTRVDEPRLVLESRVYSLHGRLLSRRIDRVAAPAGEATPLPPLAGLVAALPVERAVLVTLTLSGAQGIVSRNAYWPSASPPDQQRLGALGAQRVEVTARAAPDARGTAIRVRLTNRGDAPALNAKLTVLDAAGARVLPVFYSDNYLTLLPGESREVSIECPPEPRCARLGLRGWNVRPQEALIAR